MDKKNLIKRTIREGVVSATNKMFKFLSKFIKLPFTKELAPMYQFIFNLTATMQILIGVYFVYHLIIKFLSLNFVAYATVSLLIFGFTFLILLVMEDEHKEVEVAKDIETEKKKP